MSRTPLMQRARLSSIRASIPVTVEFPFNPEKMSDTKSVQYGEGEGHFGALQQRYNRPGSRKLSFSLDLHRTARRASANGGLPLEEGTAVRIFDLRETLDKLRSFVYPRADAWSTAVGLVNMLPGTDRIDDGDVGQWLHPPPGCRLTYGRRTVEGVVTRLEITETRFDSDLEPISAEVQIEIAVDETGLSPAYLMDARNRLQATAGTASRTTPWSMVWPDEDR